MQEEKKLCELLGSYNSYGKLNKKTEKVYKRFLEYTVGEFYVYYFEHKSKLNELKTAITIWSITFGILVLFTSITAGLKILGAYRVPLASLIFCLSIILVFLTKEIFKEYSISGIYENIFHKLENISKQTKSF